MATRVDGEARVLVIDDSVTLLRVVTAILQRHGYEVACARDGVEGLAQLRISGPFDLILLDFAMPRMNGYQFCRELRADPLHAEMPVVLMSARTDTIGDRFVEQTGAADALGKPFDARALVAVVGAVLAKVREGGTTSRTHPEPDEMVDEAELDRGPESIAPDLRHFEGLQGLIESLALFSSTALRGLRPQDLQQPRLVEDALAMALDETTLLGLMRSLDSVDPPKGTSEIMRGDLARLPLAEVMQMLQLQRANGLLRVQHRAKLLTLSIREGSIELAQSRGTPEEFRLGRYLVDRGLVTFEQIDRHLQRAPEGKLLGEILVAAGVVTPEQLREALAQQTSELVYEVMRWQRGRFVLSAEPISPAAEQAALGLGMSELVLEGFRRVDEWRLMADKIDFEGVPFVDVTALGTLNEKKIGKPERAILDAIDGTRTVREVMAATTLASFDAIRIVYGLLQSRIARMKS